MENTSNFNGLNFNMPKHNSNVIKVIGVGGGGGNAVNHMYLKGIDNVDFVICNTDAQALANSPIPTKIQLGASLTEGLGAGANPEIGEQSAIESKEAIENMLGSKTKMVFITVGMGGGTGTGAAPIIAKAAKDFGMLTVAIVTTPFSFEGKVRNEQAQKGINKLREQVDSIIVINNNKLREVYGNLGFKSGFSKADEVLSTAAMGIAKVITMHYMQNIDFRDAKTVLSNSGSAIMGSATAQGDNRAQDAISKALDSPLLNDNKITGAKNVLLLIVSGATEITIDEIGEISDFIRSEAKCEVNIIMGVGEDELLEDGVSVTVIATGFNKEQQTEIAKVENKKIVFDLNDETKIATKFTFNKEEAPKVEEIEATTPINTAPKKVLQLEDEIQTPEEAPKKILNLFDIDVNNAKMVVNDVKQNETPAVLSGFLGNDINEAKNLLNEDKTNQKAIVNHNEFDLIPTSELINNINVIYDEVVATNYNNLALEDEFIITTAINDIEVIDMEIVQPIKEKKVEDQMSLFFDLPLEQKHKAISNTTDEPTIKADLDEAKQIDVVDTEIVSEKKIFNLDEYLSLEQTLTSAKPTAKKEEIQEDESLQLKAKIVASETETTQTEELKTTKKEISPLHSTIKELTLRASERRVKMKDFNYKFNDIKKRNIDELEKQPAYKRNNIELDETPLGNSNISRTSLNVDGKDTNFRSNNSFLHDNVD